jgi:hypothetical protein
MRGRKQVASITSEERGNIFIIVACMNDTGTYVPPLIVFPKKKKYESGAYGWSIGGLNFGVTSKWLDSD